MWDAEISVLDHCTARQLKVLLALASANSKVTRDWLLEVGDSDHLANLLAEMCAGSQYSGQALLDSVCSPDTPLEALVAAKSIAKQLAATATTPAQNAAATLLYHLSIAAALGNHAQNISSKDPLERLPLYRDLAAELSDECLAVVFQKAVAGSPAGTR
jgi:hypothetical protein